MKGIRCILGKHRLIYLGVSDNGRYNDYICTECNTELGEFTESGLREANHAALTLRIAGDNRAANRMERFMKKGTPKE